jgi:hypothetical protein
MYRRELILTPVCERILVYASHLISWLDAALVDRVSPWPFL